MGDAEPLKTLSCGEIDPNVRYCKSGEKTCSANSGECPYIVKPFTCTKAGIYPDVMDCDQYYECEGRDGPYKHYQCPEGFIYSSVERNCTKWILSADCVQVDCSLKKNINQFVVYPNDHAYYVYCSKVKGNTVSLVVKCPKSEHIFLNDECQYNCLSLGKFVDQDDVRGYYTCFGNETGLRSTHSFCPIDATFNGATGKCEFKSFNY